MNSSIIMLALLGCFVAVVAGTSPGGLSDDTPSTPQVEKMVVDLESAWKGEDNSIVKLEPISYRTQVVAGTNYFIKARATHADNSVTFVHLRVYKSLKNNLEFHSMKHNLAESEPIEHF